MSVEARLRVAAGDPGIRNFGFCVIELTHVDSVVGVEGPRTRTPVPRFRILHWEVMDLATAYVPHFSPESSSSSSSSSSDDDEIVVDQPAVRDPGVLETLHAMLTSEKPDANNMPMWRRNLSVRIAKACPVLFERYLCEMTGKWELPVVANENQLDVAVEGHTTDERAEWKRLQDAVTRAKSLPPEERAKLPSWIGGVIDMLAHNRLELRRSGDFIKARMYTLSQVLACAVETQDAVHGDTDRLVINSAKKHAIASDGTRTYAQRKEDAIALTRLMLKEQRDNATSTPEERAHARKWLAFLNEQKEDGQKLDDLCDAFLMAVAVALKIHKKYSKKVHKGPVLACYAPVTNSDLVAANLRAPPEPKKRKRNANEEKKKDTRAAAKKPKR